MTDRKPYASPDEFFAAIERNYDGLSKALQGVARKLHLQRDRIALMSVQELAQAVQTTPSALVRFAQSMGFTGYSQMKNLFQETLAEQISISDNYAERIKNVAEAQMKAAESTPSSGIVSKVINNSIEGLQNLYTVKFIEELNAAAQLMCDARGIWIIASGRSFAAAAYLTYLVQHSHKPIHWLNGLCFSLEAKLNALSPEDVLIVVSYEPYADASVKAVEVAEQRKAKVIAITDSHLGTIAKAATQIIEVRDANSFGFRGLTNTVAAIQALFLIFAAQTELIKE